MSKNKIQNWMLIATLTCTTALGVAACSEDDIVKEENRIENEGEKTFVPEDKLTDEEQYLIDCQFSIMSIMQHLAGLEEVTPDVVNRTYEPTYGVTLDESAPYVRAVKCDTITDAELMFRSIAGIDSANAERLLAPTPDGYALSLKDLPILPDGKRFNLGTLTFHNDNSSGRNGYVEVAIPCIPHLERIDFLSPEAFPDNDGENSPYMKGDIVYVSDASGYCPGYYLCVKQYDGYDGILVHMSRQTNKAGNGGTETTNLDNDNDGAFRPYNRSKGQSTIFDIIKAYARFIVNNQEKVRNIKMFLNGEAMNKRPMTSNSLGDIFPDRFNNSRGRVWAPAGSPARIFYEAEVTGDYAWIPAYNYRRAFYAYVSCQSSADASVTDCSVKYVRDSYWNDFWDDYDYNYCMNVIRFGTSTINGTKLDFSPTKEILKTGIPAVEATNAQLGWCYADDGYLYENASKAKNAGFTPLGVLVYVNDGSEFGDMATEMENGAGHGLVMAYRINNNYEQRWNPGSGDLVSVEEGTAFTQFVNKTTGAAAALTDGNGSQKTLYLSEQGSRAATLAMEYTPSAPGTGWMLPSAGQWIAIMCDGLGKAKRPNASDAFPTYMETVSEDPFENINKYINDGAVTRTQFRASKRYWSSSAYSAKIGVYLTGNSTRLTYYNSSQYAFVRPVFAY